MNKLFGFVFLFSIFTFGVGAHAQMMGGITAPSSAETAQTIKDEAAGKAVWDKLENKQVDCKDLTDDDFDVLGDFFMGNMSGVNHASMNVMMGQRLGDAGEKLMHITIGKRLSGCDATASFPQGAGYFTPMMGLSNTTGNQNNFSRGGNMVEYGHVNKITEGSLGTLWMIGWLFTIGYLRLKFWRGVLALIVWPYFLGVNFNKEPKARDSNK